MALDVACVTIRDKNTGEESTADLAKCQCGHSAFAVFQVHGYTHLHLQCTDCKKVYCPESDTCASAKMFKTIAQA